MATMTMSETMLSRSYGMLASRITETLNALTRQNRAPREEEVKLLQRGETLLGEFVSGSRLVEGHRPDKGELAPRPDTMTAFQQALYTLQAIRHVSENEEYSKVFTAIKNSLQAVRLAESPWELSKDDVEITRQFFVTLADRITDDLARQRLENAAPVRHNPVLDESEQSPG